MNLVLPAATGLTASRCDGLGSIVQCTLPPPDVGKSTETAVGKRGE